MDNLTVSLKKIIELSPLPILIFNCKGKLVLNNKDGEIFIKKDNLKLSDQQLIDNDLNYKQLNFLSQVDNKGFLLIDQPIKHKIEKLHFDELVLYMVIVLSYESQSNKLHKNNLNNAELVANISHELRTPLNGIIGFSEVIIKKTLSIDKIKEYSQFIYSNGMYMLDLINSILDYAKLENKQFVLNKKLFSINRLLYELVVFYMMDLQNRNKEHILLHIENGMPDGLDMIYADELRIKQVFNNLIFNAIKFTEKGSITIGYEKKNNSYLLFYIKDTGMGIAPEEKNNIFIRYKQANKKIASSFGGSGLGLSITKDIIEQHGGSIWVESEKNKGTTFYFKIPYEKYEK